MSIKKNPLIAFVGYARAGKDEAAKTLITEANYNRVAFGDIIKQQLDQVIQRHLGFSAFTEVSEQKAKIRRTLENWGEDNYQNIFQHFFNTLPTPSVNTRLCRLPEAREWVRRGGVIIEVVRPGIGPETEWSRERVADLHAAGLINLTVINDGTLEDLANKIRQHLI